MTKNKHQKTTEFMFLAMAAVFAVVSALILSKGTVKPEIQVQGAEDVSAQELLYLLNETVDDAGQSDLRGIKGEVDQ